MSSRSKVKVKAGTLFTNSYSLQYLRRGEWANIYKLAEDVTEEYPESIRVKEFDWHKHAWSQKTTLVKYALLVQTTKRELVSAARSGNMKLNLGGPTVWMPIWVVLILVALLVVGVAFAMFELVNMPPESVPAPVSATILGQPHWIDYVGVKNYGPASEPQNNPWKKWEPEILPQLESFSAELAANKNAEIYGVFYLGQLGDQTSSFTEQDMFELGSSNLSLPREFDYNSSEAPKVISFKVNMDMHGNIVEICVYSWNWHWFSPEEIELVFQNYDPSDWRAEGLTAEEQHREFTEFVRVLVSVAQAK